MQLLGDFIVRRIERLNPLARRMAVALIAKHPAFNRRLTVLEAGDFRSEIRAPRGSNAFGLCVSTVNGTDTYVQFGFPDAFYPIDSAGELVRIVSGLLADKVMFVVISKNGKWAGTTLTRRPKLVKLKRLEEARIISWSGANHLKILSASRTRKA